MREKEGKEGERRGNKGKRRGQEGEMRGNERKEGEWLGNLNRGKSLIIIIQTLKMYKIDANLCIF